VNTTTSSRRTRIKPSLKAAQRRRAESAVVKAVRPVVAERDGYCRLYWPDAATRTEVWRLFGSCSIGRSEWAHFGDKRRCKTVGQAPEERHDRAHSLMLCTKHHDDYDEYRLEIEALTDRVCDGRLLFARDGQAWEEPA
jgi:hypothetical protein